MASPTAHVPGMEALPEPEAHVPQSTPGLWDQSFEFVQNPAPTGAVLDRSVAPGTSGASARTCTLHAHLHVHTARSRTHTYTCILHAHACTHTKAPFCQKVASSCNQSTPQPVRCFRACAHLGARRRCSTNRPSRCATWVSGNGENATELFCAKSGRRPAKPQHCSSCHCCRCAPRHLHLRPTGHQSFPGALTLVVFVLGGVDDAAGAGRLEPAEHTGAEGANANNTAADSDSCGAHLHLHTAYCTLTCFVVGDGGDAAGARSVEPAGHTGAEAANAKNTGDDSDSSADLNELQVPRKSLMNTKPHAAILIGRRK